MSPTSQPAAPANPILAAYQRQAFAFWIVVVLVVAAGIVYTIVKPPRFRAMSVLLTAQDSGSSMMSAIPGLGSDPIRILGGVLESERAKRAIEAETKIAYKDLNYVVRTDPASAQITLSWAHRDKELAKRVLGLLTEQLRTIEAESGFTVADKEAQNLKAALDARKQDVAKAEDAILAFAKTAKTAPDPDKPLSTLNYLQQLNELQIQEKSLQAQLDALRSNALRVANQGADLPVSLTEDMTIWRRKLDQAQYELDVLRISKGDLDPAVARAREAVNLARQEVQRQVANAIKVANEGIDEEYLQVLARKVVVDSQIASVRPLAEQAPKEGVEYQRLLNSYKMASETVALAAQQYEAARLKADASRVKWSVLDPPFAQDDPVNKSLVQAVVQFGILGTVLGALLALMLDRRGARQRRLTPPSPVGAPQE